MDIVFDDDNTRVLRSVHDELVSAVEDDVVAVARIECHQGVTTTKCLGPSGEMIFLWAAARPANHFGNEMFSLLLGDVSPDNGTITIGFLPQETAFQVRETLSAFVAGNDEPRSIVAMHPNITCDVVQLKLDSVFHAG